MLDQKTPNTLASDPTIVDQPVPVPLATPATPATPGKLALLLDVATGIAGPIWGRILLAVGLIVAGAFGQKCAQSPPVPPAPVNVNVQPAAPPAVPFVTSGKVAPCDCCGPGCECKPCECAAKCPMKAAGAAPERLHLGHRIVAEHFRREASRQLQKDGFTVSNGDKTPLKSDAAEKQVSRLTDAMVIGSAHSFGAFETIGDGTGPILGFVQKIFQWIKDHPEQVAAIIKFLLSLLMMFGDPVSIHLDVMPDGGVMLTAVYPDFVVTCLV